ncbi:MULTISPECIES: AAA family ATPase [Dietzia]|uniref:AAA family ATPase n=1 Tax=Dietzia cinnamea TaxID=321318 RepID=A0AAW5Q514_9ACTN|nr:MULTISPECIES: AAA family ATPase [Dietzia]MCT1639723.1 AAA family ATPase [Dietzia cinnamea]MCT1863739.1 AAA family ATPase [Dietzia cinnamea]MCT2029449.1 AAA family ATPase [Dietzia cinnamea]MCT2032163.1 AAA family ATPase [Dietzia cinnamea]MCT2058533.1 AAA family ATPase [Dietzia cinnamea]
MSRDRVLDPRPVVRVVADPDPDLPRPADQWPYSIPAVAQLLRDGLELDDLTVLVGENGAGKSTVVEAVAMAFGLGAEGGSVHGRDVTWRSESPLNSDLRLVRGGAASRWGYFLRAETMHGMFTYLQSSGPERDFHSRSHGEAFWDILTTSRFDGGGLFVLDEPEAGLSFDAQLRLVALLLELADRHGAQVLMATHSPILASVPGAAVYELSDEGMHRARWEDLAMVDHYRRYLDAPERYLRHLLE